MAVAPFCARNWSRTCRGRPYCRSSRHVWQQFLILLQLWHTSVFLYRAFEPGFHRKTQNGRAQILHSAPRASFVMRTYGLSPRQTFKQPSVTLLSANCELWRLPRKLRESLNSPKPACLPPQHRDQVWQPDLQAINYTESARVKTRTCGYLHLKQMPEANPIFFGSGAFSNWAVGGGGVAAAGSACAAGQPRSRGGVQTKREVFYGSKGCWMMVR